MLAVIEIWDAPEGMLECWNNGKLGSGIVCFRVNGSMLAIEA